MDVLILQLRADLSKEDEDFFGRPTKHIREKPQRNSL
jgi:hypothetical protein